MEISPELFARIKTSAEATPFTKHVGLVIESMSEGRSVVRLPYRPTLARSRGIVHGGAILTLMDVTGGLASASAVGSFGKDITNVTIAASTQFLGSIREADLVATGTCTKAGKSISFVDVEVHADGELVAKGAFTFKTTRLPSSATAE